MKSRVLTVMTSDDESLDELYDNFKQSLEYQKLKNPRFNYKIKKKWAENMINGEVEIKVLILEDEAN